MRVRGDGVVDLDQRRTAAGTAPDRRRLPAGAPDVVLLDERRHVEHDERSRGTGGGDRYWRRRDGLRRGRRRRGGRQRRFHVDRRRASRAQLALEWNEAFLVEAEPVVPGRKILEDDPAA